MGYVYINLRAKSQWYGGSRWANVLTYHARLYNLPDTTMMKHLYNELSKLSIIQFNSIQFKIIFIASYNTKINTNRNKHKTWGEKHNHNTAGEIEQHCVT